MTLQEPPYDDTERPRLTAVRDEPGDNNVAHQNPPAEKAVLGALLLMPELAEQIRPELDAGDFYQPRHETIWDAIHTLAAAGTQPDPVTVGTYLHKHADLVKIGGAVYLHDLMAACPIPTQAAVYARDVRDAARLRAVAAAGTRLRQIADTAKPDQVEQALERAVQELDAAAVRFGPGSTITAAQTGLRDLTWLATGDWPTIQPPEWIRRTDGAALFYTGRVNGIFGDPESAKTWLAQMGCIQAMAKGQLAAIIDVDHNGQQLTVSRMGLMGATADQLANPNLFRYYEPDDAHELRAAITDITNRTPAVVVLDSMGEMLPMLGVKSVDNDEITAALRDIASPPARAGACVIGIDHLPKSHEARNTGFAIGGTAKKRAIDGSYIHAETRLQPSPGQLGKVTLRIEKDRPGELRKTCTGKYIGDFILDSRDERTTIATISRAESPITPEGTLRPTYLMEQVSRFIEDFDQCTGRQITDTIHGRANNIRAALQQLINEGFVTTVNRGKATLHHSHMPYRQEEPDEQF